MVGAGIGPVEKWYIPSVISPAIKTEGTVSKKKKKNGYGKGTFIETKMFLSKAFMSLGKRGTTETTSCMSTQILMCFLGKRQFKYRGKDRNGVRIRERVDNNRFTLTYKELERYNITQPLAVRAFDELLAKGFIEKTNQGGAFKQDKAIYALVDDWQFWQPGNAPVRKRPKDIKRGWQGKGRRFKKQNSQRET